MRILWWITVLLWPFLVQMINFIFMCVSSDTAERLGTLVFLGTMLHGIPLCLLLREATKRFVLSYLLAVLYAVGSALLALVMLAGFCVLFGLVPA
jgi:hypothetical protein